MRCQTIFFAAKTIKRLIKPLNFLTRVRSKETTFIPKQLMMKIEKYSMGMGDRFGRQGEAQLAAIMKAADAGVEGIVPVWNKSNREHTIIGSCPDDLRKEADDAVKALGWKGSYYVDADHIGLKTVDWFLAGSNFFTLDVADDIGSEPTKEDLEDFMYRNQSFIGKLEISGIDHSLTITREGLERIGRKYVGAMKEASRIYQYLVEKKGEGNFVTEVSTDETDTSQSPEELFFILSELAHHKVPVQTIAPKFTGEFIKGVDYIGQVKDFCREFEQDLMVIKDAIQRFGLPDNLKLSVHTGSDKFSLYPHIGRLIRKHNAGLHLKTAGTTWLEEVIGLAEAGGEGLAIAKNIYTEAYRRYDELTAPYANVIHIEKSRLPSSEQLEEWSSEQFVNTLRHDPHQPDYQPDFRQLIHVAFKVAAEMGDRYLNALDANREVVARNVTTNLWERHFKALFIA